MPALQTLAMNQKTPYRLWVFGFFALVAACLYFEGFIWPHVPIYQGDSSPVFILEAMRMLRGEMIYRDFFELVLPGAPTFYFLLFKWLGIHLWIPAAVWVLLGIASATLGWIIARSFLEGSLAFLPSLIFVGVAFSTERDPTHHWFSGLFVLAALGLIASQRADWRLAAAGACCGLSTLFTQNTGPVAAVGIAAFLAWEGWTERRAWRETAKAIAWLALGVAIVTLPVALYLIREVGFDRLLYCTFTFPMTYLRDWFWDTPAAVGAEIPRVTSWLGIAAFTVWASLYFIVLYSYFGFPARFFRSAEADTTANTRPLMLLAWVGLFEFVGMIFSPTWIRVCSVSFPAFAILVWRIRHSRLARWAIPGLTVAAATLLLAQPILTQSSCVGTLRLPAGRAAFLERSRFDQLRWLRARTKPGQYILQASDCDLYFPLELRDPIRLSQIIASGFTRPREVQSAVRALDSGKVRFVLWSVWLDAPAHEPYPAFNASLLSPIRAALRERYHIVGGFGAPDYEQIWQLDATDEKGPSAAADSGRIAR